MDAGWVVLVGRGVGGVGAVGGVGGGEHWLGVKQIIARVESSVDQGGAGVRGMRA